MRYRVTRAAGHLSEEEVCTRMQSDPRLPRRKHWQIIYEALTVPRSAEEIARTVGLSPTSVHRVISLYNRRGVAALETPGKGGRHRQYLTVEQERAFLQPFEARAAQGEIATVVEIHQAFEQRVGHPVDDSTVYRRHEPTGLEEAGWRHQGQFPSFSDP